MNPTSHRVHRRRRPRGASGLRLKSAGRRLRHDLLGALVFEPFELHLVHMVCVHTDLWAASARGKTTRDRAEARAQAIIVSRLLRELRVHQADEARPPDLTRGRRRA